VRTDVRTRDAGAAAIGEDRPARWRKWAVLGMVLVVVAAVIWAVGFSSLLGVRNVEVQGSFRYLTAAQVEQAAAVPHGRPLLRLDTANIVRRVQRLPDVAAATVRVSYPSTVVVAVAERVGVGYVQDDTGVHLVDHTGLLFRSVAAPPPTLPRFQLAAGPRTQAAAAAAATTAAALPQTVLAKLATIQADDPNGISLLLRDQRVVRWGSADRSSDKARVLVALLGQPGTVLDVSNPDLVYAR
jgi:cell division protein FtsQ